MSKPTLLQHILKRPSQSYASPTPTSRPLDARNFHSVMNDMARAAGTSRSSRSPLRASTTPVSTSSATAASTTVPVDIDNDTDTDKVEIRSTSSDEYYTPNTSPRESYYNEVENQLSMDTNHVPIVDQIPLADVTHQQHDLHTLPSHSRSPSTISYSSATSVASSSTAAASCEASAPTTLSATSTRPASPAESDNDKLDTVRSSSSRSSSLRRRREDKRRLSYTDDDWSKDVRWLVPFDSNTFSSSSSSSKRSRTRRYPESSMLQTLPRASTPDHIRAAHRRSNSVNLQSTMPRCCAGRRRMSAVWEEDEDDESSNSPSPRRVHTDPAPLSSLGRSRTVASPRGQPRHAHTLSLMSGGLGLSSSTSNSAFISPSRTVDIPVPLPVSDGGNPSGFTKLVLPRAAYTPSNKRYSLRFGGDSHVDITRSGLSQTTMSTISITKNAAAATIGNIKNSTTTPAHLLTTLPPPLSFTSHTPPPSKVNSHQILVQVYAVGLDGLDNFIVNEKATRNDCYGFVPGRSFVGRAVECGFEVSAVAKSDWVMGLLDIRKCGGLSEFVVVDKRRLTHCPRPSPSLTMEQLALLPLCGIPAHRAVRTTENVREGGRALVLQGHDGAGALVVQELAASGMHVTVHIPSGLSADKGSERYAESLRFVEERVRRWGATAVCVDDTIGAVESFAESAFDFVIDTVGGRHVWNACRRVLHTSGQFTTLVGETRQAVPSVNAHFRANLRSLRRAFVKKDSKALGYAWISPVADVDFDGENIRDSLVAINKLAVDGVLNPWVDAARCVPFERAPSLFATGEKAILKEGRTGVVRIID